MTEIVRVTADDWSVMRQVRLAALRDTPDAFWATHDDEVDRPESWWREFAELGACFIAFSRAEPVGIAAVVPAPDLGDSARRLISMWVAPDARGRGVGRELVDAAIVSARADGAHELQLEVTEGNEGARRLYERCGFRATGKKTPLPRNPAMLEHEMVISFPRSRSEPLQEALG